MILSICIPTHDGRAETLRATLDSIVAQLTPDLKGAVEVCVSDNGSEDGTRAMIFGLMKSHPGWFTYHRFPENIGGRRNFLKSVEIGSGTYGWLVGSDDILEPDAIRRILSRIGENPDLPGFYVNRIRYNRNMTKVVAEHPHDQPDDPESPKMFTSASDVLSELAIYQNYMSSIVFKRRLWALIIEADGIDRIVSYRHYTHSYVWCRMTVTDPRWAWFPDKVVRQRIDNDSYVALGATRARYVSEMLDDMRRQLRDTVGIRSQAYWMVMRKLFELCFWPGEMRGWKCSKKHSVTDDLIMAKAYTAAWFFIPKYWYKAFPLVIQPHRMSKAINEFHKTRRQLRTWSDVRIWLGLGTKYRAVKAGTRHMAATAYGGLRKVCPWAPTPSGMKQWLAPRTRFRAVMSLFGLQNGWTQRYDAHVERALELAGQAQLAQPNQPKFTPSLPERIGAESTSLNGSAAPALAPTVLRAPRVRFANGNGVIVHSMKDDKLSDSHERVEAT